MMTVWRSCTIYNWKNSFPDDEVCLYFRDDEYEGLRTNTYHLDKYDHLYDSYNDLIPIRNLVRLL